jgi:hypothetical protein
VGAGYGQERAEHCPRFALKGPTLQKRGHLGRRAFEDWQGRRIDTAISDRPGSTVAHHAGHQSLTLPALASPIQRRHHGRGRPSIGSADLIARHIAGLSVFKASSESRARRLVQRGNNLGIGLQDIPQRQFVERRRALCAAREQQ